MGKNIVLVDMEQLDNKVYTEFYPRVSHKQRKRLMNCIRRNTVKFEDETSKDLLGLTQEEFSQLSEEQKFVAYENLVEMFCGSQAELEEQREKFEEEKADFCKKAW